MSVLLVKKGWDRKRTGWCVPPPTHAMENRMRSVVRVDASHGCIQCGISRVPSVTNALYAGPVRPWSSPLRRAVIWLLVLLLPLEGLAVAALTTLGPAHVHRHAQVLHGSAAALDRTSHVLSAFGHFHASATPERHHHALGDIGVVLTGDDAPIDQDSGTASLSVGATFAMLPHVLIWCPPPRSDGGADHRPWAVVTHDPDVEEPPPRSV
jgi:hypothetical protein